MASDRLFDTIAARLTLMQPVAAWKFLNDAPVEDLKREAVVLDAATKTAAAQGLDPEGVRTFFQAQIDAAKDIQLCWLARWQSQDQPQPQNAPDLQGEIRPDLITLGDQIVAELAHTAPVDKDDEGRFEQALSLDCLSTTARDDLWTGLLAVRKG